MSPLIHPSAIVDSAAQIADDVEIGPFCVVEANVQIGAGSKLKAHVVVGNGARIGVDVNIFPGAVISTAPQDLKYADEPTIAVIGDRTTIRECVTVNRGTTATGTTRVGNDVLLMAYTHIAHDCVVGDKVIIANSAQLGGHVTVGYHAIIGGLSAVHQFSLIGEHAMIAGATRSVKDIPPFVLAGREPVAVYGLNIIGLRRRGFTPELIASIQEFYNTLYHGGLNITEAIAAYELSHPTIDATVQTCIDFIRSSKRGIARMVS